MDVTACHDARAYAQAGEGTGKFQARHPEIDERDGNAMASVARQYPKTPRAPGVAPAPVGCVVARVELATLMHVADTPDGSLVPKMFFVQLLESQPLAMTMPARV